ncbi:MAG: crossover junction endodeoxyribonuclease RuvC, partial [Salinibacterium sp.]|nr:crossover junction endodeoxyribonuclease RuvC [Salinibacterium sp.]
MTILGIDPGTREMGAVVVNGGTVLALGVHTLTNGHHPRDLIDQARRIVLSYIEEFSPEVVGIEKPLLVPTKRAALVSVIAQELHARSRDLGTRVIELSAREVRRIVVGNPRATKFEVAQALARSFPDLAQKLPKAPPHPV